MIYSISLFSSLDIKNKAKYVNLNRFLLLKTQCHAVVVCVFLMHWDSEHVIVSSSVVLQQDPNTTRDTPAIKV